jgi:hypothetical protein
VPAEVREAAMALTPDAIRTLGEIMRDPKAPPATRVTEADKILDRALGRPAQTVDVRADDVGVRASLERRNPEYSYGLLRRIGV